MKQSITNCVFDLCFFQKKSFFLCFSYLLWELSAFSKVFEFKYWPQKMMSSYIIFIKHQPTLAPMSSLIASVRCTNYVIILILSRIIFTSPFSTVYVWCRVDTPCRACICTCIPSVVQRCLHVSHFFVRCAIAVVAIRSSLIYISSFLCFVLV